MSKPTINCTIWKCKRYGDHRCCVGCREPCEAMCLNHPDHCKLVAYHKPMPLRDHREEALELYNKGRTVDELAEHFGVTPAAVYSFLRREGVR